MGQARRLSTPDIGLKSVRQSKGDFMAQRQPATRAEIGRRLAGNPFLSDFIRPFPNLLEGDRNIQRSFERIAESLAGTNTAGAIQFSIREGDNQRHWSLVLSPKECHVAEVKAERPRLEILTDADTWLEVAEGNLTPIEAFGSGRLRVRGDLRFATLLARRLWRMASAPSDGGTGEDLDG
jgi:putative sterol carrier protein